MRNGDLIKELLKYSDDTEVAIFDINLSEKEATEEPSSAGIYPEITVYKAMTEAELREMQKDYPNKQNFVCLQFDSEKY